MKTKTACSRVVVSLSVAVLSCVSAMAQTNLVSRPVGIVRIQIPAGEQKLVSIPFRPFDVSINAVLQGQLSGAQAEDLSDKVFKWDPLKPGYVKAVKADGTGDPAIDGKWFKDFTGLEASEMTFEPGEGFFICNQQDKDQVVLLAGEVVLDDEYAMMLYPALNLVGYPYSSAGTFTNGMSISAHASTNTVSSMNAGAGYWLNNGEVASVWMEVRPYANVFPDNDMPPLVTGVMVSRDGAVTLNVLGAGDVGALLEVYYKDMSVTGQLEVAKGWSLAQGAVVSAGDNGLQWIDSGDGSTNEQVRYYLIGRGDIDSDRDGIPDAREMFVDGTMAPESILDSACGASGGIVQPLFSEATVISTNELGSNVTTIVRSELLLGRIIYVDRKEGRDELSGRGAVIVGEDGPKKTIRAGLKTAKSGDQIVLRAGNYKEDLILLGKRVFVTVDGSVRLEGRPDHKSGLNNIVTIVSTNISETTYDR